MSKLTEQAQEWIRAELKAGEFAIDATAGNGYDTLFLANCVGPTGTVFAVDVQPEALQQTASRMQAAGMFNVTLIERDHAELAVAIPQALRGRIGAAMFNLGYLPGGDKSRTTRAASTVMALAAAIDFLRAGGVLTILAYIGHPGGAEEAQAVESWLQSLPEAEFHVRFPTVTNHASAPRLFVVRRRV